MSLVFNCGPTGQKFLRPTGAAVKLVCGPVGGGKSTLALMELFRRAVAQAPYKGVRRTKAIILRNTMQQLKTTVKPLIDQWFITIAGEGNERGMGQWRLTENVFEIRGRLPDGTEIHAEWYLMAADTPDDVRRLLSVEASFGWAEECREIDPEVFRGFRGRMNRFPNRAMGGVTEPGVICSTNPPPIGSYWHEVMTDVPEGWEIYMQPPAILEDGSLNPDAENLANLAPGYYENLMAGASEEWIDVYLRNKYGLGNLGQPVWRQSFKKSFHVSATPLRLIAQSTNPLIVGMDNGLTAAAVAGQMDARGRVNLLGQAYVPPNQTMGVEKFLDTLLIPMLRNKFPSVSPKNMVFVLDPACFQRSQVNEITIAQAVAARGFAPIKAYTNDPERRIAAVEGLLNRQIDGGPALLADPELQWLIDAMEWGYRFKRSANGQMQPTPDKNHHSHIAEALQYLALHYNLQIDPASNLMRSRRREVKAVTYTYV